MLKKYKILDLVFLWLCCIFILLSIYEFFIFIIPHYSYQRSAWVFFVLLFSYFWYNVLTAWTDTSQNIALWSDSTAGPMNWNLKIYSLFRQHLQAWVYGSFIITSFLIIASQIFDILVPTVYAIIVFSFVYLLSRLNGCTLHLNISKSSFRSFNVLRFVTILYVIFYTVLSYMLDKFQVPAEDKVGIYIVSSLLYIISMSIIFFDIKPVFSSLISWLKLRVLRPYPIFMLLLICGLSGYLVAKNNLVEQIGQWVEQIGNQAEIQNDGGVILPQVVPSDNISDVVLDQEIQYETVLVGEQYNIETGIQLWSVGQSVELLQTVLWNLQYFLWEVNGEFGEDTRDALTVALQSECNWPETTRWIFGPQAKECIDSLEISRQIEAPVSWEIISDEAIIN